MNKSGILLHIAGLWLLSGLDASGKWLVLAGVPVLMVAWARYAVHTALMTAVVLPTRGKAIFQTKSLSRQLVRGLLMITTTVLFSRCWAACRWQRPPPSTSWRRCF